MALQGRCLSGRERDIAAALIDTMAAPLPPLPEVAATDAVDAVDAWLSRSPSLNRLGVRAGLRLVGGGRFTALDRAARTRRLKRIERTPLNQLLRALGGILVFSYYGDDGVCRVLGYDADAVLARARA